MEKKEMKNKYVYGGTSLALAYMLIVMYGSSLVIFLISSGMLLGIGLCINISFYEKCLLLDGKKRLGKKK
jgi:hypothetical protein